MEPTASGGLQQVTGHQLMCPYVLLGVLDSALACHLNFIYPVCAVFLMYLFVFGLYLRDRRVDDF